MDEPVRPVTPWDGLTREQLIRLLTLTQAEVRDYDWTHRPSDDFEGCTE